MQGTDKKTQKKTLKLSELKVDERKNLISFFELLLKVDKRNNPALYQLKMNND